MSSSSSSYVLRKELLLRSQRDIATQCNHYKISIKGKTKVDMVNELIKIITTPLQQSSNNNDALIQQLLPLNLGSIPQIQEAISKVKNKTDINEIAEYLLNNKPKSYETKVNDSWEPSSNGIKATDTWSDDEEKEMKVSPPKSSAFDHEDHKDEFKDNTQFLKINKRPMDDISDMEDNGTGNNTEVQSINDNKEAANIFASYRWKPNMCKPYRQEIQHELVVDFWARNAKLFQNPSLAGILVYMITVYSVPAFKFRYGNEKSLGIYNDGLLCHQLLKTQCSALFGPRIKYDGLDANMIYKFKFKMLSGNIGIGLAANDYVKWNKLLHDVNDLRHSIIWKNGFYHYNLNGKNDRSIRSSHYDDIFEDNDIVELEIDLVDIKCRVRNLTNYKVREREIPIKELVKYPGSTGYLQIVIGFFDDFGSKSWVKGAGKLEIIEQRGEYVNK
mmetsp:Transcript_34748/g.30576  ORF Transcript_34748/g.30576 Transcript_34748/m.30576 type:complete len:445 (+) Transcript_34748:67-1401(+)